MTLHLIKDSAFSSNSLALCLEYLSSNDAILLLEDGVLAAIDGQSWLDRLLQSHIDIFVLKEDVVARALGTKISSKVTLIDIDGFVELTEQYESSISW